HKVVVPFVSSVVKNMFRRSFLFGLILILISIGSLIPTRSISARSDQDQIDLAIVGGSVVTMDGRYSVIEDGYVAIRGDRIIDLGSRSEIEKKYKARSVIDATGKAVMPG